MLVTNVSCRGQIYLLFGEPGSCWLRMTDLKGLSPEYRGRGKGGKRQEDRHKPEVVVQCLASGFPTHMRDRWLPIDLDTEDGPSRVSDTGLNHIMLPREEPFLSATGEQVLSVILQMFTY